MSYEVWHWRLYNVLLRLLSLGVVAVGIASCVGGIAEILMPTYGNPSPLVGFAIGLGLLAVGLALCRLRAFRPDLGDGPAWIVKLVGYEPRQDDRVGHRSWWTGDPDAEDA